MLTAVTYRVSSLSRNACAQSSEWNIAPHMETNEVPGGCYRACTCSNVRPAMHDGISKGRMGVSGRYRRRRSYIAYRVATAHVVSSCVAIPPSCARLRAHRNLHAGYAAVTHVHFVETLLFLFQGASSNWKFADVCRLSDVLAITFVQVWMSSAYDLVAFIACIDFNPSVFLR